ncbi:hypothetical protein NDN08_004875 [Rhodosorus marinus]|uniref:Pherophorin domain-containing protein n=1 Tax=Rhodosorus marinus TaxID=101924 RepID=A0AAV8UIX4_9RHOD|nr:hypothetical protein NDN08_004875 [Rhodosorus marinus]
MMRVVALAVFSLALLGMARSARVTCAASPAFARFEYADADFLFTAPLKSTNGTEYGTVTLAVNVRQNVNCFAATFRTRTAAIGLLRLRVGIFGALEDAPTGKDRFTRRKRVAKVGEAVTVTKAGLNICPSSIIVDDPFLCCQRPNLDLYATALISTGSKVLRVYMRSADADPSCRTPNPGKPFRQVCTLPVTCLQN